MKKQFVFVMFLAGILMFSGCNIKQRGWEAEGVIAVMADAEEWEALEIPVRKTFERVIRTPQFEHTFNLRYVKPEEFKAYTEYHYLVLLASLESKGHIGDIVNKAISNPEIRAQVERGERFYIQLNNQWAQNQILMMLVAKDNEALQAHLLASGDEVYRAFDDVVNARLKKEMFDKKEQVEIEKRLMRTYNWSIRLQHDYFIAQEVYGQGIIWFRRMFPERWIFVRWIDDADASLLNQNWVINERNRIGAEYYGNDKISDRYLFSYRDTFLGRPAQITEGLWENDEKNAGGPFKNYTFYDADTKRVYMLDLAIYAPARDKMPYLKRHEIIAHTFRTIFDVEIEK